MIVYDSRRHGFITDEDLNIEYIKIFIAGIRTYYTYSRENVLFMILREDDTI